MHEEPPHIAIDHQQGESGVEMSTSAAESNGARKGRNKSGQLNRMYRIVTAAGLFPHICTSLWVRRIPSSAKIAINR